MEEDSIVNSEQLLGTAVDTESDEMYDLLFRISHEFVEETFKEQVGEEIFAKEKTNYLAYYTEKAKYLKKVYRDCDDEETVQAIKDNTETFYAEVLDKLSETFDFDYSEQDMENKRIRTLYEFFVIDYVENLKMFFMSYIQNNKKDLVNYFKKVKPKGRDLTAYSNKLKYKNTNDLIILNNINKIIYDIIPSVEMEADWIFSILDYEETSNNRKIKNYLISEKIAMGKNSFAAFMKPFIEQYDGYSEIASDVVLEFTKTLNPIDNIQLV